MNLRRQRQEPGGCGRYWELVMHVNEALAQGAVQQREMYRPSARCHPRDFNRRRISLAASRVKVIAKIFPASALPVAMRYAIDW